MLGLGFIFALQYLIPVAAFGPPPFLPCNMFILGMSLRVFIDVTVVVTLTVTALHCTGVLLMAFVILQFYNGAYKRMGHEAHKAPLLGGSIRNFDLHFLSAPEFCALLYSYRCADPESGSSGNPLVESSVGAAQAVGSPVPAKVDSALVRVTSLSGGSANSSAGVVIGELSVANSSINMWHVRHHWLPFLV